MTYKMIVLDLDDTLLRDDHTISPRTKEALMTAQEQGVKVVLASGRPTFAMRAIAKELHLEEYGSFILSFNGAKLLTVKQMKSYSVVRYPLKSFTVYTILVKKKMYGFTHTLATILSLKKQLLY